MPMTDKGLELLDRSCKSLGIGVEVTYPQFSLLYDLLVEASQRTNLTALRLESDIVLRHFVDSLTCLQTGLLDGSGQLLDLGTGAGFPGIPLAVARPNLRVTLVDATQKKIEFVKNCISILGLKQARAVWGRGEVLGRQPEWRGCFDRVVSRAVGAVPMMLELGLPMLQTGGYVILQKGPEVEHEVEDSRTAARQLGATLITIQAIELPQGAGSRRIVVYQKTAETESRYPRLGAALGRF